MIRTRSKIFTLTFATLVAASSLGCTVEKTEDGKMPDVDVDVEAGKLPKYDVDVPDVDVTMKKKQIRVPDVDVSMKKAEVTVPDVDVTMPNEQEEAEERPNDPES